MRLYISSRNLYFVVHKNKGLNLKRFFFTFRSFYTLNCYLQTFELNLHNALVSAAHSHHVNSTVPAVFSAAHHWIHAQQEKTWQHLNRTHFSPSLS